jgi:hypothetical protein
MSNGKTIKGYIISNEYASTSPFTI